nr:zf-CCHC domain-containing protein/DUF4219 domain-containing protein/UBN2 domain-containing protein [Tanacetum cinerariifolium]
MTLYNTLPRKEYKRVFMWKTGKEVWHTLILTHLGNLQVKNYKTDLLTQEYEKFTISNKDTIDSGFPRFNAIMTSLKSLDPDYSSTNHIRKNQFGTGRGNSFEDKGGESSKNKGACYNFGIEGHFASECRKPKENKAFIRGALSDSKDRDEKLNDATCLMAIDSQEVVSKWILLKLLKGKYALEDKNSKLSSEINNLEIEVKKLANDKEVVEPCKTFDELTKEVNALKCNISKL